MGCGVSDPFGCVGAVIKSVSGSVAGDAFNAIAQAFGTAADHAISWLWAQISAASALELGGAGFTLDLDIVAAIAGSVAVGLFVLQVIQSVLRREPGGLARAVKGLVVAFIGGGAAIATLNLLLGLSDKLSSGIVEVAIGSNLAGLGRLILGTGAFAAVTLDPAALLLLALGALVAVVIVYAALVIRKVLIVVTAVFAPLAFAGSLADITVSWTRRWIEMTLALVFSKVVLVLIFVIGYGILVQGVGQAGSGVTGTITQVIAGILVLCLAGFAPWLAYKMVHFTGEHAQQVHALGGAAAGGAVAAGSMAGKAARFAGVPAGMALSAAGRASRASAATAGATEGGVTPGPGASGGPGGASMPPTGTSGSGPSGGRGGSGSSGNHPGPGVQGSPGTQGSPGAEGSRGAQRQSGAQGAARARGTTVPGRRSGMTRAARGASTPPGGGGLLGDAGVGAPGGG